MRYEHGYVERGRDVGRREWSEGRERLPRQDRRPRARWPHDRDYWWLGEHEMRRRHAGHGRYDAAYYRFGEQHHPRFTPVGGMYHAMGGRYARHVPPRPIREPMWFSEWTRWF